MSHLTFLLLRNVTTSLLLFVVVIFLSEERHCHSFVPTPPLPARHRLSSTTFSTKSSETLQQQHDTSLISFSPSSLPIKSAPSSKQNDLLHLDTQGNLRLGDRVLLNGFQSSVWSTISPDDSDDDDTNHKNGLFLHTKYVKESSEHEQVLGDLVTCHRLLACARQNRYWMGPKFGSKAQDIPLDTQFLLMEVDDGSDSQAPSYALFMPLLDNGFRASLQTGQEENGDNTNTRGERIKVFCVACSGDASIQSKGMRALYVATGQDPFQLIHQAFAQVSQELGTFQTLQHKQIPPFVNDFGWCTWDAFYSNVTAQGVLDGVESLCQAGTPPRTLILDDGWQQVSPDPPVKDVITSPNKQTKTTKGLLEKIACTFFDTHVRKAKYGSWGNQLWIALARTVLKQPLWEFLNSETDFTRQLSGFGPNAKFESPDGGTTLKGLVSKLKNDLGVHNVLCWHALHGYWRGVSEDLGRRAGLNVTTVFPHPTKSMKRLEPLMESDPVNLFGVGLMSNEDDLAKFYELLHTPLVEAGIDGVKVDVQSGVSTAGDRMGGGPTLAKLYTRAMEESVEKRFAASNKAANVINCMCHSTENLYRYQLTSVARASEDFFPDRPDSQTAHLINVAYNSLFIGEICVPDWDMFHSHGPAASLHAAARAIGGCPVYVSDAPGQHDPNLLRKLVLPDGSILRAQLPGRPTRDCLFTNVAKDNVPLKIWNRNAASGVVGAFHVQGVEWNFDTHENDKVRDPVPLVAHVKPYDVETLRHHPGPFGAWRHQSSRMEFLATGDSVMKCPLNPQDWEAFTIVPLQVSQGDIMWGPVGLVDMINSGGAIVDSSKPMQLEEASVSTAATRKTQARCTCRGPGRFVAFTNCRPVSVSVNGKLVAFAHEENACELSFILPKNEPADDENHHRILVEWN